MTKKKKKIFEINCKYCQCGHCIHDHELRRSKTTCFFSSCVCFNFRKQHQNCELKGGEQICHGYRK